MLKNSIFFHYLKKGLIRLIDKIIYIFMSCFLSFSIIFYTYNRRKSFKNIKLTEKEKLFLKRYNKIFNIIKIINCVGLIVFFMIIVYLFLTIPDKRILLLPLATFYIIAVICEALCGFFKLKKGFEL